MSNSESLLQGELPRDRCGKAFVFLAFALGLGLGAMIAITSTGGQMVNESSINMALQPTLAQPSRSMMPVKSLPVMQRPKAFPFMQSPAVPGPLSRTEGFRTNAFHNPSALAGSSLNQKRIPDIRNALGLSPAQKCFYANKHASLCGNVVVLRPETALRAESGNKNALADIDSEQILKDLSDRWDAVEDKTAAVLYASGAVVALYFANSILATVNAIPLLPGLLEAVGLGYSGWFAYRYLLTKSSRQELVADIDELKKKISS